MKFLIEFSDNNLIKFRSFIRMCNKIFYKTGIIMTITKDKQIKVVCDPFNISDKFQHDYCTNKTIEIYRNLIFVEYLLIPKENNSQKNSTFDKLDLKTTKKQKNDEPQNEDKILTFRISREELNKLNDLLQNTFQSSNQLTLKATEIPEFMKNEKQNYSNAFLSIFDKPSNAIKSGILFKPLKKPYIIQDYEDEMDNDENGENNVLGELLFSSIIKSKYIRKFASIASKNENKKINFYIYKDNDLKEHNVKIYLILSYLTNSFDVGCYIENNNNNDEDSDEEFNNINKYEINGDLLIKMLKNFSNDVNNPDYISLWSQGLVIKTNFTLRFNFDEPANNEGNNFFENDGQNSENNNDNQEDNISYMTIKAFKLFENKVDIIPFEGIDINNEKEKRNFILKLIANNVDDKHEELNKSLDLSDISGMVYRNNNSFMEEDEEDDNYDDIEENIGKKNKKKQKIKSEIIKEEVEDEKNEKGKKNKKKVRQQESDNEDSNNSDNDDSKYNSKISKKNRDNDEPKTRKIKKKK